MINWEMEIELQWKVQRGKPRRKTAVRNERHGMGLE